MQSIQTSRVDDSHLNVVFSDTVMSFNLAAGTTYGEIANSLDKLSTGSHGYPVAINLTMASRSRGMRHDRS